jgi:diguanylate cyclase (GGDEF)-like protein
VLPETAGQQADVVLDRVLGAMQHLSIEIDGREYALSASAGVAAYPNDGQAVEELVAKAATTMYTARAGGKGRVGFYSSPPRP